jgi:hypothetical protein
VVQLEVQCSMFLKINTALEVQCRTVGLTKWPENGFSSMFASPNGLKIACFPVP